MHLRRLAPRLCLSISPHFSPVTSSQRHDPRTADSRCRQQAPQLFIKPGDVCEIEVDAVGVLRNGIRDE